MRSTLTIVFCAALTLWLGGLVALFIFVQAMFNANRAVAVEAAPMLFNVFEKYQLILFAIAMISVIAWRLIIGCSTAKRWIMLMVILAGSLAIVQTAFVSSRMTAIRQSGQSGDGELDGDFRAEFRRLHGYSMMIYVSQTALLAAAACLLPAAISAEAGLRRQALRQTSPQTGPA